MIESYSARVSGTIWNGTRAWTTYTFQSLPTREQIIEKAGDFEHVSSITLTRTTTKIERVPLMRSSLSATHGGER